MECVENMRKVMNASGAYALNGQSLVDQELYAYGAGLESLEAQIQQLEEDMFAMTAGAGRLGLWERLYRRQPGWGDIAQRRRAAARALSRRGGPVMQGDLQGILEAAGITGSAEVSGGKIVIHADGYAGITPGEAAKMLGRLIPLHVQWEIENA